MGKTRLLIVSDAWKPQCNGVVTTLTATLPFLDALGFEVTLLTPESFRTLPCPRYPEIRLAITTTHEVGERIRQAQPDCVHIVTEGPLGILARRYCGAAGVSFTSAFRSRYAEYLKLYIRIPLALTYSGMRWFHRAASRVMVTSEVLAHELKSRGFRNLWLWPPGVDTDVFQPQEGSRLDFPRPIMLYVGRIAVEKNVEAFLDANVRGTKVIVGDGPYLDALRSAYPQARFVGRKSGSELAQYYSGADVLVFPSRTDTFGLVMLEALACGTPVAAYPEQAPLAAIGHSGAGCLSDDLSSAIRGALEIPSDRCRAYALNYSWSNSALMMAEGLVPCQRDVTLGRNSVAASQSATPEHFGELAP